LIQVNIQESMREHNEEMHSFLVYLQHAVLCPDYALDENESRVS